MSIEFDDPEITEKFNRLSPEQQKALAWHCEWVYERDIRKAGSSPVSFGEFKKNLIGNILRDEKSEQLVENITTSWSGNEQEVYVPDLLSSGRKWRPTADHRAGIKKILEGDTFQKIKKNIGSDRDDRGI